MPAEIGPVQTRLRRRAPRGWGTRATAGQVASAAGRKTASVGRNPAPPTRAPQGL